MPEALAVFFIFAVSAVVYVTAQLRSRDPSLVNVVDEFHRLRRQEAWLRQRLELAAREQWGRDMIAALADEHRQVSLQLARAIAAVDSR